MGKRLTDVEHAIRHLDRMLKLYETKGWCKGPLARSATGIEVDVKSRRAVEFCLLGARLRTERITDFYLVHEIATAAIEKSVGMDYVLWNEQVCKSKRQAVAAVRRAKRMLEKQAKQEAKAA